LDEYKHSSKASGATPAGALTHPHGGNFTHSRTEISCGGGTHPHTFDRPIHEGEGDFIALYKQRLQRATGLKPSKSTNTLPLAWQFSLSWGGVSDEEEHQAPGWHDGQVAKDCGEQPQTVRVQRDALLASFLLASPPPKTMRGVKLADSTLHIVSPRATLSPRGTMRRTATKPSTSAMVRHLHPPSG